MSNGDLTLEELYTEATAMCRKHWDVDFTGTIELVNRKWTRYNGMFCVRTSEERFFIRLSCKTNAERTRSEVLGTLLHELVHWRLYTTGQPFRDVAEPFIAECLRVGAPISGASAAQRAYRNYLARRKFHEEASA
ncbi:hypothetical protein [Paenibacillus sp. SI8]|uniref:hypothetical protein n=1 Tax=unclassified Paenibacillus TaxID=185978 RepID=UPI003465C873